MTNILESSLKDIAAALRSGETSSEALAEAAIANHERTSESLGAYKAWDPERLRAQARAADAVFAGGGDLGPLHGIPVSVKDLYGVKGFPTFAGTPKRLPAKWEREGPVVRALRRQQAVMTGKTHTVEFAFGGVGMNPHWGTPRNPWGGNQHRVPGGSSAGAGVSLGAGSALVALGSDTAGSVRIPASVTGNVGLKTSYGRWSLDGIVPLSPSLDTAGPLTRTVADSAYAFLALDPAHGALDGQLAAMESLELAGLRIGVADRFMWDDCAPGVAEGVKAAIDELAGKGAQLIPFELPEAGIVQPIFMKGGLVAAELYAFLKAELPDWLDLIEEIVRQRMDEAATLPAHEYLDRRRIFAECGAAASERLREVDVLVGPTVPTTAPTLEEASEISVYKRTNLLMLRNTGVVNYLGLCALTMPVALDDAGMPVGLHLIARHGEEERLLAIGLAFERVLGTARQRLGAPPLA
jgi:aspartyl-tRNA(Asn)/glutamyl-tRNA(Gln) amidotransferase subunit A